jgi:probable F420-dependent oxidoreductase
MTIPLDGLPLTAQADVVRELEALGYTDLWSSEGMAADGFTPLAVAAAVSRTLHLGIAIASTFTRGPALLAQTAATLAATAPGRFTLGLGSSSNVLVEDWNGISFTRPLSRNRDVVRLVRRALTGERIDEELDTVTVRGLRIGVVPEVPPPILLAGMRAKMLTLAGAEADGAIINWLSAADVPGVVAHVAAGGPGKQIVARLHVILEPDADAARTAARRILGTYLNVPVYREFHRELGRDELEPMWALWAAGERRRAIAAIPDRVVDDLVVHGDATACREHVRRFVAAGVTTPVLYPVPVPGADPLALCRALAP